jgi:hypothetical protein
MIPEYLSNLQLSQVFATYTNTVDQFIQESTADELIVDSEIQKISGFVDTNFGQTEKVACKYFSVSNPTQKPYALLQIDNGIIQSSETKKCDCAIANDASLCFIEFKANANSSNLSTIAKNYKKAIEQLITTIGFFYTHHKSQGIDFRTLRAVEAYICFRHGYPRSTSTQMNYQVSFAVTSNGIPLSFRRSKVL